MNVNQKEQKIAMLIAAHPDDMEFLAFHGVDSLIKSGYHLIEVVMTDGAYGILDDRFKGKRLKRIRKHELMKSALEYGTDETGNSKVEVVFIDKFSDGFLPFSYYSMKILRDIILKYRPQVTLGMDPFYPIDYHHDHINTGRNYYFALKSMPPESRPRKMYYYQSFRNNVYISLGDFGLYQRAMSDHKSQLKPIHVKLMNAGTKIFYFLRAFASRGRFAAGLRKVKFTKENNSLNTFQDKVYYHFFFERTRWREKDYKTRYIPLPEVGFDPEKIEPQNLDPNTGEKLDIFYFGKNYK